MTMDTADCRRRKPSVQIRLVCGCKILVRIPPLKGGARFGCTSGLGHGYMVEWAEWTDTETGRSSVNMKAARK